MTTSAGPKPVVEAARPALEAIWARLAPHVSGAYANFLSSATAEDVAAIYPSQVYNRLAAVDVSTTPAICSPATTTSGRISLGPSSAIPAGASTR